MSFQVRPSRIAFTLVFALLALSGPALASIALPTGPALPMTPAAPAASFTEAEAALEELFPKPSFRSSTYLCHVQDPCNPPSVICSIQCEVGQTCNCIAVLGQTEDGCRVIRVFFPHCI